MPNSGAVAVLLIFIVLRLSEGLSPSLHPDAGLNITELTAKYGYPLESHEVQTDDGYILTIHRIPHGANRSNAQGSAVLLMHGLLCSSVDWINMGPDASIGLLLADQGYDVWIGNERGNTWSRKHATIDPNNSPAEFFNFSFHEIGFYDLPAMIDYILDQTKEDGLYYIGHSQGTTSFFVMASEKPQYNEKIKLMTALAPVAYMGNLPNPIFRELTNHLDLIETLSNMFQIHEFLPHYEFITKLGNKLCSDSSEYQDICVWIINMFAGFDWEIDPNFIPVITSNVPAGGSIKQILHYLQEVSSTKFCQFDYGSEGNKANYGQDTPPVYNVEQITAPVSLYYSENDWLAAEEDVLTLAEKLPNLVNSRKISLNRFNHLDFLWARHIVELLNNFVLEEIKSK